MQDYPKKIKRLLNEFLATAYERELQRELAKLDASFAAWRNGQIGSGELSHRVHQYEVGPSRVLYQRYNHGPKDLILAYVIVAEVLRADEVPTELLQALERQISFYQELKDRAELRPADDLTAD